MSFVLVRNRSRLGHKPDCRLGWSSEYVRKSMYACHSVSVACRPDETRWRRGEIGSIRRSILVGHRRPNRRLRVKCSDGFLFGCNLLFYRCAAASICVRETKNFGGSFVWGRHLAVKYTHSAVNCSHSVVDCSHIIYSCASDDGLEAVWKFVHFSLVLYYAVESHWIYIIILWIFRVHWNLIMILLSIVE